MGGATQGPLQTAAQLGPPAGARRGLLRRCDKRHVFFCCLSNTRNHASHPLDLTLAPSPFSALSSLHRLLILIATSTSTTMAVDEGTQTNGASEPAAGKLNAQDVQQSEWTVQSGTS